MAYQTSSIATQKRKREAGPENDLTLYNSDSQTRTIHLPVGLRAILLCQRRLETYQRRRARERRQSLRTLFSDLLEKLAIHITPDSEEELRKEYHKLANRMRDNNDYEDALVFEENIGEKLREEFLKTGEVTEEPSEHHIRYQPWLELSNRLENLDRRSSRANLRLREMEDDHDETVRRETWWHRLDIPHHDLHPSEDFLRIIDINVKKAEIKELSSSRLSTKKELESLFETAQENPV